MGFLHEVGRPVMFAIPCLGDLDPTVTGELDAREEEEERDGGEGEDPEEDSRVAFHGWRRYRINIDVK